MRGVCWNIPVLYFPYLLLPLLALPWLHPFTFGPNTSVVQGLLAWLGLAVWWLGASVMRQSAERQTQVVALAWLVAAGVSAVMGLLQYLGLSDAFGSIISSAEIGQAFGNLRQRNHQATLLVIGLAALLWWCADAPRIDKPAWQRWVCFALATLLAAAIAASGSRTGLFQLVLLVGLAFVWHSGRLPMLTALVAYAVSAFALPYLAGLDPFSSGILGRVGEQTQHCASRTVLWQNVLHLIAQKPWLGWGWGELDYAHFVTLYPGERFCDLLDNAHNLPLHLAVELGIPFATVVCGLGVWLLVRAAPWRELDASRQMAWAVLAALGVHSLLEYPLWYGPFQVAAVLALAILWNFGPLAPELKASAAIALIAVCAFVGFEYVRMSQIYLPTEKRFSSYQEDTLNKIRFVRMFQGQVKFADLTIHPLTLDNAAAINQLAQEVLHFSPEPRVVEKAIESAVMLKDDAQALFWLQRYRAAYPDAHARWAAPRAQ